MNCHSPAQPGGCAMPTLEEIHKLLEQYTKEQIAGDPVLRFLQDRLIRANTRIYLF